MEQWNRHTVIGEPLLRPTLPVCTALAGLDEEVVPVRAESRGREAEAGHGPRIEAASRLYEKRSRLTGAVGDMVDTVPSFGIGSFGN